MADIKPNWAAVAEALAAHPEQCRAAIASIAAGLGSKAEWDSDELEWIPGVINQALLEAGLPVISDGSEEVFTFWTGVYNS
ncbi:Uncharacterised protein (plasmid) [Tsukamurella tyrosinosolvens]|uniref:Uncharacterized protein n=1 Tax=Tsukamurella tyrosinosolvens TaxID=57704 RepID=A0A1H4U8S2_TSUTY|nr:hypothetical protein [Tsukamurella tyrosinosolvens]KXO93001.1 hypothetical protein AXK58_14115 [Tsukamurella tyrosinosolvens]SEC64838.1 hypothetical protein SAMN04489793_2809 [Tsukamurella tyrosinosolvens]VEH94047.1 Uncharacterised protein [Tsukamurella tyrosinosolvens]